MEVGSTFLRPPSLVRNFCMLAHVDHGKTTLADFLISSNGVLAPALAGKVRYMDGREDEQRKEITVKTSSIALEYGDSVLNLVDSPGHVDFSVEVSVALRVCDGALVLVDVVDGVTSQTEFMLRHAYREGVKVCLILNKIDLLYSAVGLSASEAEQRMRTVIESCNVIMSVLRREDLMSDDLAERGNLTSLVDDDMLGGEGTTDEEEECWFSPSKGNVAFTSGLLGFGFTLSDFVGRYHTKYGWSTASLTIGLWGNYYFDAKKKRIAKMKSADCAQETLFAKLVLTPLWDMLTAASQTPRDIMRLKRMVAALELPVSDAELHYGSQNDTLQALLRRWLPLDKCLMKLVKEKLPSPCVAQRYRIPNLLGRNGIALEGILNCDPSDTVPTVCYVAKLIEVAQHPNFFCFTRVLSGVVSMGQTLYIHNATTKEPVAVVVKELALFRGYGVVDVASVRAGSMCAIGAEVADHVVKCATLCSLPIFSEIRPVALLTASVLRTAVRPKNLGDLATLVAGLKILNRVDIQVDVVIQERGDYVLCTAGEVHAERCMTDLTAITKCELELSPPAVPFRETILQMSSYAKPKIVTASVPGKQISVSMYALRLPQTVRELLQERGTGGTPKENPDLVVEIKRLLHGVGRHWVNLASKIWCIGSVNSKYTNILFSTASDFSFTSADPTAAAQEDAPSQDHSSNTSQSDDSVSYTKRRWMQHLHEALCSGFNVGMDAGPLCEEPLTGIAIVISDVVLTASEDDATAFGTLGGQTISMMRMACRAAVSQHTLRIVEPLYECDVMGSGDCQGKICAIISQRRGEVLIEEPYEGSNRFLIRAILPVIESIGLSQVLRMKTSGKATCHLRWSAWRVVDEFDQEEDAEDPADPNAPTVTKDLVQRIKKTKGLVSEVALPKAAEKQKFSSRCT